MKLVFLAQEPHSGFEKSLNRRKRTGRRLMTLMVVMMTMMMMPQTVRPVRTLVKSAHCKEVVSNFSKVIEAC
jgi:hypothetical protein